MIVPMVKYDIVLHSSDRVRFLERLAALGLVDITTTGWEPGEGDRVLISRIEQGRKAIGHLEKAAMEEGFVAAHPYDTAQDAMMEYRRITTAIEEANAAAVRLRKEAEEVKMWGDFSPHTIGELKDNGIDLLFYTVPEREMARVLEQGGDRYVIERVAIWAGTAYFVIPVPSGEQPALDALQVRPPSSSYRQYEEQARAQELQAGYLHKELARCAASTDLIRAQIDGMTEELDINRITGSASCPGEGSLLLLEGWATRQSSPSVDAFLKEQPALVNIKSNPTPEDATPILLKNNRFASLFELIGDMYSKPRYGTIDLTRSFAPFYMIFFGFCLGDGGYGALLILAGWIMSRKAPAMKNVAYLTMLCGAATVVFGILTGAFFGIPIVEMEFMSGVKHLLLTSDSLFGLALGLGAAQMLFGMGIKVANLTRQFGFRYALSTIGWMVTLLTAGTSMLVGVPLNSPASIAGLGVGIFLMLFMNSPGKGVISNFGSGLWNTYNDVVGFIGDLLSYIRLFAIGLSGGTLALVFNDVAVGLSPDIPGVKQVVMILILLVGHGINLFMSTLGAFVHPLRLTFLEFYKNAGYESADREFKPYKKITK